MTEPTPDHDGWTYLLGTHPVVVADEPMMTSLWARMEEAAVAMAAERDGIALAGTPVRSQEDAWLVSTGDHEATLVTKEAATTLGLDLDNPDAVQLRLDWPATRFWYSMRDANLRSIKHELETPMRGHDEDGECCAAAARGDDQ